MILILILHLPPDPPILKVLSNWSILGVFFEPKKKRYYKENCIPYDHLVSVTLKYHRKNNFLIRYSTNEPPHNGHLGDRRKWPSNLWHIIFERDSDSHFVIDGDLSTALCWSDHQVMVLILLRGTFGVGLRIQGAPSLVEIHGCISWWIPVSNNVGDSDEIVT